MARTSKSNKKAVAFGAGNIGRGFVGCFLNRSDYEIVFVDVTQANVDRLNAASSYKVIEVGTEGTNQSVVDNFRAINSRTNEADVVKEISTADVVTCSVGPPILKHIAPVIAKGINARPAHLKPLAVIACENMMGATSALADFIKAPENTPADQLKDHDARVRYANCAIDRIVPAQDPKSGLDVKLETFYEWVVDKTPFADCGIPSIKGIHWVDNLEPFIERKLFTLNTCHATTAYFGYNRAKRTVYDALQDKEINAIVRSVSAEVSALIIKKHGFEPAAQKAYAEKIIMRIANPHLEDAVERVGRGPLRKLGRKDRLIGPGAELAEHNMKCDSIVSAIEMAFRFQNVTGDAESAELGKIMASDMSNEDVVQKVCGLTSRDKLFPRVVQAVGRVRADSRDD